MRISTGVTVNVSANTERWLSEIRSGRAFATAATQAGVAGELSFVQLFNPAASPVTVLTRFAMAWSGTSEEVSVRVYNTALTTLVGNGTNLLDGGAASVAEFRSQSNVADLGAGLASVSIPANDAKEIGREWLVELAPGQGLLVRGNTANTAITGSFFWVEV